MNSRKVAYLAVLATLQKGIFAANILDDWRKAENPSQQDLKFAREIAYGAIRMANALDYIAEKAANRNRLSLKPRERALIRCGTYQLAYMDRTPGYAAVNECVKIAKELRNPRFPGLLNAILRKIADSIPELPQGGSIEELSIRYSYPKLLIQNFLSDYGLEKTEEILRNGNIPSITQARKRKSLEMIEIDDFSTIANDPSYYIQNYTPAFLIDQMTKNINPPKRILDLCAAPGGKLLAAHDLFPFAKLFANELAKERIPKLQENIKKYDLHVDIKEGAGENYQSPDKFDLIILDVPCSNSGVLNKRPEARWRINEQSLSDLNNTQLKLLENSSKLLSEEGSILYMTCSVLKRENEMLIHEACKQYNLKLEKEITILPDSSHHHDGGYGCLLTKFRKF